MTHIPWKSLLSIYILILKSVSIPNVSWLQQKSVNISAAALGSRWSRWRELQLTPAQRSSLEKVKAWITLYKSEQDRNFLILETFLSWKMDNMTLKTRWNVLCHFVCILSHISYSDVLFFALWMTLLFRCLYVMNPVRSSQNRIVRTYISCDHRARYPDWIMIERWQGPPHINKVKQCKLCCPLRSVCSVMKTKRFFSI